MLRQDAAKATERWSDGAPEFVPNDHHRAPSRLRGPAAQQQEPVTLVDQQNP